MTNEFTTQSQCFDNTRLSDYKACPRKYLIRHVLGWYPTGSRDPLVFGLSWHESMDVIWKGYNQLPARDLVEVAHYAFMKCWEEQGYPTQGTFGDWDRLGARTPGTAKEMMWEYVHNPARANLLKNAKILAVEQPFAVPFPSLENVWYVGRLDKAFQYNGQKLVGEHKTTTAYAREGGFRSDYVESWYASSQVKGYQFGAEMYFPGMDGVWIDAALVHNKIHDAFRFIPVAHNITLLKEWLDNTGEWIGRVIEGIKLVTHSADEVAQAFPKNEDNCWGKFGSCEFLDICRTCPNPCKLDGPPAGFKEEKWEPFDLLGLDKLVKQSQGVTNETK